MKNSVEISMKCRCVFVHFNKDKSVPQNSFHITCELNKYSCHPHFAQFDVNFPQFETNFTHYLNSYFRGLNVHC